MFKKIFLIGLISCVLLNGCGKRYDPNREPSTRLTNIYEWVSPDGVHYWVYDSSSRSAYGLAPRYDSNGNLVIDKKANV